MRIPSVVALVVAAAALTLAGCTDDADAPQAATGSAPSTAAAGVAGGAITVEAVGSVDGTPDVLTAEVGVEVAADDVDTAYTRANEAATAVRDALADAGVADQAMQTAQLSLRSDHRRPAEGEAPVVRHVARTELRVELTDLERAGAVLDQAVAAAGGQATLRSLGFAFDDDSDLLADARQAAFEQARAKAAQYAQLAERELGQLQGLSESSDPHRRPPTPAAATRLEQSSGPPVEPGQQQVQVRVRGTWALR